MRDPLFKSFAGQVIKNKNLANMLAYRIGGPARFFLCPESHDDYELALRIAKEKGIPLFILGSGTNLLVADRGYAGIILWMGPSLTTPTQGFNAIKILEENENELVISVPAAYAKAQLLDWSLKKKLSGLEFSAGIPGTLGGAVYMNAGTKWGSYGEIIRDVSFFSLERGHYTLKNQDIGFKYRGHGEGLLDGQTVVTSVTLTLQKNKNFTDVLNTIDEIYIYRGQRQPLELPNCGSVFKNPSNSEKGAGRLIEACDLKGLRVGQAEVSLKHANFILNRGGAQARDVQKLIKRIQAKVFQKFSVELEREVIFVGL